MFKKTKTGRIIASFIALMMLAGLFAVSVCADDTLLWDTKFDGYTATDGLTVPEGWTGSRFNSNNTVKAGSDATYGTTVVIASTDALNAGVSWTGMDVGVSTASLGNRAFHLKTAIKRDTLGGFDAVLETASWRLITFGTDGNIYSGAYWGRGAFICSFTPGVWYEIDLTFVSSQKLLFGTISSSEGVKNFVTSGYENPGGSELTFGMRESGGDGFLASAGDASMAYFTAYVNDDSSLPGFEESYDFESFELGSHESNNGFYSNDTSAISIVDTGDEIHNRAVEFDLNTKTKFYAQFIRKSNGFPAFSSGKVVAESSVKFGEYTCFRMLIEQTGGDYQTTEIVNSGEDFCDINRWYRVRYTYDLDAKKYTVTYFPEDNPTDRQTYEMDIKGLGGNDITTINEMAFIFDNNKSGVTYGKSYLDDIKIYEVVKTKSLGISPANGTQDVSINVPVTASFNMPIASATAVSSDGTELVMSKNADETKITFEPVTHYSLNSDVTVTISNIVDAFGNAYEGEISTSFKTVDKILNDDAVVFKNAAGEEITDIESGKVTVSVNYAFADDTAREMLVIAGLYSKTTNRCEQVILKSNNSALSGTAEFTFDVPENARDYKVVTYLWNSFKTIEPYTSAAVLD